jgi:hypothetical protein
MTTDTIAQYFKQFVYATRDSTPLYEKLSLAISEDPELIEALMIEDGELISHQPLPNILFGAVNTGQPLSSLPSVRTGISRRNPSVLQNAHRANERSAAVCVVATCLFVDR